jgi:hypothetical protein
LEFLCITLEKILKPPQEIKLCSENSFTCLSRNRIGSESGIGIGAEFCSSKLIDLPVIFKKLA